jgi:hypothetical protein
MTARATEAASRAAAHCVATGCTPAVAAALHGLHPATVRRALARLGVPAMPRGRRPAARP